ncbi:unnamed protein product, partial [Urochloa humidicola]
DRVLVKLDAAEKTAGGILLPSTAQTKPQGGEVVAVGPGRTIGDKKIAVGIETGAEVVYSKYAGTEVEFNDSKHLILKEDDIIGILESDDVKDMKPLNDRVLIKVAEAEVTTPGGLILTETTKEKPSIGTVVAVGPGRTIGDKKIAVGIETGAEVVYSKYAGTEVEFNDSKHLILKEDDIIGILESDDVKDMKPLNDRVLIKVAEAEVTTPGGLILTETTKEKPSIGTVVAVGPGPLDDEGKRQPLSVPAGSTVLYSKYAGNEFKGADGTGYIVLRASDVMAVLS